MKSRFPHYFLVLDSFILTFRTGQAIIEVVGAKHVSGWAFHDSPTV